MKKKSIQMSKAAARYGAFVEIEKGASLVPFGKVMVTWDGTHIGK
jgi:hypothetical protein